MKTGLIPFAVILAEFFTAKWHNTAQSKSVAM